MDLSGPRFRVPCKVDPVFRFCVGTSSFVSARLALARGDDAAAALLALCAAEGFPAALASGALVTLALALEDEGGPGSECEAWRSEGGRLRGTESGERRAEEARRRVEATGGRGQLEQLERAFGEAWSEMRSDRETQTRILQDSHSLVMSQVAARGDEPSEELLANQKLQMAILEGKYVRELENLAATQRQEYRQFVTQFAAIEQAAPLSALLETLANTEIPSSSSFSSSSLGRAVLLDDSRTLTRFQLLFGSSVCKVSCVACSSAEFASSAMELGGAGLRALVVAAEGLAGSKEEKAFCEAAEAVPELLYDSCSSQIKACRQHALRQGSVFVTKHSNLASCQLVFHLVSASSEDDDSLRSHRHSEGAFHAAPETPSLAQVRAKTRVLVSSLRQILTACDAVEATTLSLPLVYDEDLTRGSVFDEDAFNERIAALVAVVREALPRFRHVRFFIPPKLAPTLTEACLRTVRSIKVGL